MKLSVSLFVASILSSHALALSLQARAPAQPEVSQANSDHHGRPHQKCVDPELAVPFLRAYNPSHGVTDHFYTTDPTEMENALTKLGYRFEGNAGAIFSSPHEGTVPLYRLNHSHKQDHFYTTNAGERDNAILNLAYRDEGIAGYVYESQTCGSIALYRLFSPSAGDHFYTTSAPEQENASKYLGYNYEGIQGHVLPA